MTNIFDIKLSEELKKAVHIAQSLAKEFMNQEFSPAHLLSALLHKDVGLTGFLINITDDIYYVEEWAEVRIEQCPKTSKVPDQIHGDEKLIAVIKEAENISISAGLNEVTPVCALAALCTPGVGFSYEQLKTLPITRDNILAKLTDETDIVNAVTDSTSKPGSASSQKQSQTLLKFCVDKNAAAKQGKLEKVFEREAEILSISEILSRKAKPNVIITGEPGVGKTALIDGFVTAVVEEKVPPMLRESTILELDTGALIAGASYKGEIEDRFKSIVSGLSKFAKPVLFIDEIHTVLDKDNGMQGLVSILKMELTKGGFTLIGTTTNEEYRKHVDNDEALKRRCEVLNIKEPTEEKAVKMVEQVMSEYSEHHNLKIEKETIEQAISLSNRYIKERRLPDSAISLIDQTMAAVNIMKESLPDALIQVQTEFEVLKNDPEKGNDINAIVEYKKGLAEKLSYLLFNHLGSEEDEAITTYDEGLLRIEKIISSLSEVKPEEKTTVEVADVAATVSKISGIPAGKIMARERERLINMEDNLKKGIIGQDHAVKTITEAIIESRAGLSRPGQPIGSFFLLGPTGTGKTELAKQLANYLFQSPNAMIRFDMSEFKEEHSAALLYGAPPGYVGYEEGGMLVNKIREQPYSVVLFDEIEKAHASVFDIFLQILDEGKLHDRLGKEGNFNNAVVLFTSNIGSNVIVDQFNESGTLPESNDMIEIMSGYFRPEFLGRLTGIVPFAPITHENAVRIFDLQLKELIKLLEEQGITLKISDEARDFLADEGFTPKYGARPLRGVIRSRLRSPLSKMIITGKITQGSEVSVEMGENNEIEINQERKEEIEV